MTPRHVLETIRSWDPDGGSIQPTNNDYIQFHTAVVAEFGKRAWDDYNTERAGEGTYE